MRDLCNLHWLNEHGDTPLLKKVRNQMDQSPPPEIFRKNKENAFRGIPEVFLFFLPELSEYHSTTCNITPVHYAAR